MCKAVIGANTGLFVKTTNTFSGIRTCLWCTGFHCSDAFCQTLQTVHTSELHCIVFTGQFHFCYFGQGVGRIKAWRNDEHWEIWTTQIEFVWYCPKLTLSVKRKTYRWEIAITWDTHLSLVVNVSCTMSLYKSNQTIPFKIWLGNAISNNVIRDWG